MRRLIEESRVVLTGASSGIGWELGRRLGERRCRIVINARREDRLQELAKLIEQGGGTPLIVSGDVTDSSVRDRILETASSQWGGLDILVNNAGVGAVGNFADASQERLRRVMEVNFFAATELTRQSITLLRQGSRPILVNVASVLGHRAVPLKSEYCASKFAMHGWSDALRAELVHQGIDVLLVSPSTTDSEFFDSVLENRTGGDARLSSGQSPAYVARRMINAIERGRHEIILSWSGWYLVWFDRLLPGLADRLVARFGK